MLSIVENRMRTTVDLAPATWGVKQMPERAMPPPSPESEKFTPPLNLQQVESKALKMVRVLCWMDVR